MLYLIQTILIVICLGGFSFAQNIAQSRDLFIVDVDGKKGFMDRSGKVVIESRFDQVQDFSSGIARVWMNCRPCERRFIDMQGNFVRSPILDEGQQIEFHEGLAAVTVGEIPAYKYGFIDNTGKLIIQPQFISTFRFSEGLAAVMVESRRVGYIDKTGKMVIEPKFDGAWDFSEGLARVKIGEKWGFIDKKGNIVISPQFDDVNNFSEGLASVQINWRWGFIDKTGKLGSEVQVCLWFFRRLG